MDSVKKHIRLFLHVVDLIRGHYQLYDDDDDNEIWIGSLATDIQLLVNFYFQFRS